jgi:hypothetical protein
MKLNLEKCTFSVPSGKLLKYMISRHGINPNLEKVSAITNMKPHESLLEQVHLATQRHGAPFHQIPQKTRQVPVDQGGTGGIRTPDEVSDNSTYPRCPETS